MTKLKDSQRTMSMLRDVIFGRDESTVFSDLKILVIHGALDRTHPLWSLAHAAHQNRHHLGSIGVRQIALTIHEALVRENPAILRHFYALPDPCLGSRD